MLGGFAGGTPALPVRSLTQTSHLSSAILSPTKTEPGAVATGANTELTRYSLAGRYRSRFFG